MTEGILPQIDDEATQVDVVVFTPGNCGCNQASIFLTDTDPGSAPGLDFVALDADGPLLKARFHDRVSGDKKAKIGKWFEAKPARFSVIQFGKREGTKPGASETAKPRPKLFGVGGDVAVGKQIVDASIAEIKAKMKNKDLVFNWGAGGGGIGTSALEAIAAAAVDMGIPHVSIMITPFANEGSKLAVADKLRTRLRELGPLLVIRNEDLPKEKRDNVLLSQAYSYINEQCRPIFRSFREFTQVVGTSANADLNDFLKGSKQGRDVYVGISDLPTPDGEADGKLPVIDTTEVVRDLMNHPLQQKDIRAGSLLFCFRGPWKVSDMDAIMEGVQQKTKFPEDGVIKRQNYETWDEMWVSVIIFGDYDKAPAKIAAPVLHEVRRVEPPPVVMEEANDTANAVSEIASLVPDLEALPEESKPEKIKTLFLRSGGVSRAYDVPASLYDQWHAIADKPRPTQGDYNAAVALAERIAKYEPNQLVPDIPPTVKWVGEKSLAKVAQT